MKGTGDKNMSEFKTNDLWVVFYGYHCYEKSDLIIYDNQEEAKHTAQKLHKSHSTLENYLENKRDFDRDAGYEEQIRMDNGLYADPDDI